MDVVDNLTDSPSAVSASSSGAGSCGDVSRLSNDALIV